MQSGAVAFGVPSFAPEANVQDRCVGRHVRNSPVEKCSLRVEQRRNDHREAPAAIQRQENLHLTPCQVQIGKRCLPLNLDSLAWEENLSSGRRNQPSGIRACRRLSVKAIKNDSSAIL